MKPGSRFRTMAVIGAIVAAITLLAGGSVFLYWPTWLSGGYVELTVYELTPLPDGRVLMRYDEATAYGTLVEWVSMTGFKGWGSSSTLGWNRDHAFLRWPHREKGLQRTMDLTAFEEKGDSRPDPETLHRRLLLKPGTYRIRWGDVFVYARTTYANGVVGEAKIRVKPDPAVISLPSPAPGRTSR